MEFKGSGACRGMQMPLRQHILHRLHASTCGVTVRTSYHRSHCLLNKLQHIHQECNILALQSSKRCCNLTKAALKDFCQSLLTRSWKVLLLAFVPGLKSSASADSVLQPVIHLQNANTLVQVCSCLANYRAKLW
jgi:hypothetical protein